MFRGDFFELPCTIRPNVPDLWSYLSVAVLKKYVKFCTGSTVLPLSMHHIQVEVNEDETANVYVNTILLTHYFCYKNLEAI